MTGKDDTTRDSDGLPSGWTDDFLNRGRSDDEAGRADGNAGADPGLTREEWEQLPSDPDTEDDLGYRVAEWEEYSTIDGTEALMFLPTDESLLREDAFVVAEKQSVEDLKNWY